MILKFKSWFYKLSFFLIRNNLLKILKFNWNLILYRRGTAYILKIKSFHALDKSSKLWEENKLVPIYNSLGDVLTRAKNTSGIYFLTNCIIHCKMSFVIDYQTATAFASIKDVGIKNHNYSHGSFPIVYLDTALYIKKKENKEETIDQGIFMCGRASNNYYHALLEILSRLYYLSKVDNIIDYPLLVDQNILEIKQFEEALNILNIIGFKVRPIKEKINYKINKLIMPSDGVKFPYNLNNVSLGAGNDFIYDPNALKYIRLTALRACLSSGIKLKKESKIFIARKQHISRRPYNEDELWSIAERYGFVKVYPEDLTFLEQVYIFNNCKYLIANAGAALTNILFMGENSQILYCVSNLNREFNHFTTLAKIVNSNVRFITGEQKNKYDLHGYFNVNLSQFENQLFQMLKS